jgi:two-component system LytT family response regulator
MRALIVDDEPAARRRLADLLDELGVQIEGEAADGVTGLALARERRPDVIFLDVSMPEVDGFDVARHLSDPRPLVIFQTAYTQYAVKAFEHDALDYVVKPVTRERLAMALDRARRRLDTSATGGPGWAAESLAKFGAAIGHVPSRPERLLVRHGAGHQLVAVASIERFTADERLVYAVTADSRNGTDYTLQELETRLGGAFVRASRADLVNVRHIDAIARNGDGSATLTLKSGKTVHVSRRRAGNLRAMVSR